MATIVFYLEKCLSSSERERDAADSASPGALFLGGNNIINNFNNNRNDKTIAVIVIVTVIIIGWQYLSNATSLIRPRSFSTALVL